MERGRGEPKKATQLLGTADCARAKSQQTFRSGFFSSGSLWVEPEWARSGRPVRSRCPGSSGEGSRVLGGRRSTGSGPRLFCLLFAAADKVPSPGHGQDGGLHPEGREGQAQVDQEQVRLALGGNRSEDEDEVDDVDDFGAAGGARQNGAGCSSRSG